MLHKSLIWSCLPRSGMKNAGLLIRWSQVRVLPPQPAAALRRLLRFLLVFFSRCRIDSRGPRGRVAGRKRFGDGLIDARVRIEWAVPNRERIDSSAAPLQQIFRGHRDSYIAHTLQTRCLAPRSMRSACDHREASMVEATQRRRIAMNASVWAA